MKGVRFTKAEAALVRELLEWDTHKTYRDAGKRHAVGVAALNKLEAAEMPVKKPTYGVTVPEAIEVFRGVLGRRLIAPPWSAAGVLAQMKNRLVALGLTRGDCTTIAKVAAAEWQGPVRAESLVRQADKLMAMAQQEIDLTPTNNTGGSPVELTDEDV